MHNTSRSVGARGRIALVLAQAREETRASLKEPTRPYTPASLDARTALDVNSNTKSSKYDAIHEIASEAYRTKKSGTNKAQRRDNQNIANERVPSDLQLLILDLQDALLSIETESNITSSDNTKLEKLLKSIALPIDKFSRYIRTDESSFSSVQREVEATSTALSKVLTRVIEHYPKKELQLLSTRHILKLYLSLLNRYESAMSVPTPLSFTLLHTFQSMYKLLINDNLECSTLDNQSTGMESSTINEIIIQCLELNLDLLATIWTRINQNKVIDDDVNEDEKSPQDSSSNYHPINGNILLLESAVYASGILRNYSSHELHRRRLLALGTIDTISDGLQCILTYTTKSNRKVNAIKSSSRNNNSTSTITSTASKAFFTQASHLVTQLVASLRNFSLDSSGRNKLLDSEVLPTICNLLRPFKSYPEVQLNCVRVTAKLSLLEPFRSQINSNANHVVCLVEVILKEAEMCRKVMFSENSDESELWPYWYTWPLMSRTAFTLGNLTTTNDSNRILIGSDCQLLKPLIMLLQACSCSLSHLRATSSSSTDNSSDHSSSSRNHSASNNNDGDTYTDDSYEEDDDDDDDEAENYKEYENQPKRNTVKSGKDNSIIQNNNKNKVKLPEKSIESNRTGKKSTTTTTTNSLYTADDKNNKNKNKLYSTAAVHSSLTPKKQAQPQVQPQLQLQESLDEDNNGTGEAEEEAAEQELTDATIKLLRLLANLCMDGNIGTYLAKKNEAFEMLLELLNCSVSPEEEEDTMTTATTAAVMPPSAYANANQEHEELLLNVVAACTNLTYYACQPRQSRDASTVTVAGEKGRAEGGERYLSSSLISIALRLANCLFHENDEIVLEAARAMGNLTRRLDVLLSLQSSLADETFILLLNHSSLSVVSAVTGALVNQTAEPRCLESLLVTSRPAAALVTVLRRSCFKDLALSTLVCQVFHNILLHGSSAIDTTVQQSLFSTLSELVECAQEFNDDEKYGDFLNIGRLVLSFLES